MPLKPQHLMKRCPVNSKGVTRTKELIQGWKRSEILMINTIRKSDLYAREYRPVGSTSRWSSVVIATNVVSEVARTVLEAQVGWVVGFSGRYLSLTQYCANPPHNNVDN